MTEKRSPVFDYIRCIAVLFVVLVHVIGLDLQISAEASETLLYRLLDCSRLWLQCGNIIFIMLSGALLLPYREEAPASFLKKRFSKVAIPLVIWFLIYYFTLVHYGDIEKAPFKTVLWWIVTGDSKMVKASHFYFIYTTFALYVIFVFLRNLFINYPYQLLTKFVIAIILISASETFIPFQVEPIYNWSLLGWLFVAIAGVWITQNETRKYDTVIILLGCAATIIMCVQYMFEDDYNLLLTTTFHNLSPFRIIIGMAIFSCVYKIKSIKSIIAIKYFSKYSYGIMLGHFLVMVIVSKLGFYFPVILYKGTLIFAHALIILALSFVVAFIVDKTLVAIMQYVFSKVTDLVGKFLAYIEK